MTTGGRTKACTSVQTALRETKGVGTVITLKSIGITSREPIAATCVFRFSTRWIEREINHGNDLIPSFYSRKVPSNERDEKKDAKEKDA